MEDAKIKPEAKDSVLLAAASYLLNMVVAVLIYLIAKEDKYARYHALQSLILNVSLSIVFMAVFIVGFIIYIPVFILTMGLSNLVLIPMVFLLVFCILAFNVYLAYLAYKGRAFMLPYIGKMALKHL